MVRLSRAGGDIPPDPLLARQRLGPRPGRGLSPGGHRARLGRASRRRIARVERAARRPAVGQPERGPRRPNGPVGQYLLPPVPPCRPGARPAYERRAGHFRRHRPARRAGRALVPHPPAEPGPAGDRAGRAGAVPAGAGRASRRSRSTTAPGAGAGWARWTRRLRLERAPLRFGVPYLALGGATVGGPSDRAEWVRTAWYHSVLRPPLLTEGDLWEIIRQRQGDLGEMLRFRSAVREIVHDPETGGAHWRSYLWPSLLARESAFVGRGQSLRPTPCPSSRAFGSRSSGPWVPKSRISCWPIWRITLLPSSHSISCCPPFASRGRWRHE